MTTGEVTLACADTPLQCIPNGPAANGLAWRQERTTRMGHALSVTHACRRIDIVTRVLVQSPSRGCALPLDRSRCGSMDVNLGNEGKGLLPATVRSPGGMIGRRVSLVARPRRRELTRNHTTPPCCGSLARTRASANVVINLIVSTRRLAGALYAQLAGAGGCC